MLFLGEFSKTWKLLRPGVPPNNKQNLHQGCGKVSQIMKEISAKVVGKSSHIMKEICAKVAEKSPKWWMKSSFRLLSSQNSHQFCFHIYTKNCPPLEEGKNRSQGFNLGNLFPWWVTTCTTSYTHLPTPHRNFFEPFGKKEWKATKPRSLFGTLKKDWKRSATNAKKPALVWNYFGWTNNEQEKTSTIELHIIIKNIQQLSVICNS
jgi:hypothetical protein